MPKLIQLRNVPDSLHRKLKSRAALGGMSLSEYLIRGARKIVERRSIDEILTRLARRTRIAPKRSPAAAVRKQRDVR